MESTTPFQPWTTTEGAKDVKLEKDLADDAKTRRENVDRSKHSQTTSHAKETFVPNVTTELSATPVPEISAPKDRELRMDSNKISSMQQIVEKSLGPEGRQRVSQLLEAVEALNGSERLLLYLRLPTGVPPHDPLKQPVNPLGSRAELQQTVTWIQTHLEVDPEVSLPKQDVYDEYIAYCMSANMKPLSTADFGKVMKQVYPSVRPRRLGTRGNSRYCYAGLRKKIKLEVPQLPDLGESSKEVEASTKGAERIVCDWAETMLGMKISSVNELSRHLLAMNVAGPSSGISTSPPPLVALPQHSGGSSDDSSNKHLMKQLKRKIQTQGTPGRPKKNKAQDATGEPPPSIAFAPAHSVKHESEHLVDPAYGYQSHYGTPTWDIRTSFTPYGPPPRAHPPHVATPAHPVIPVHEYRPDPYAFEQSYPAPHDLTLPPEATHNLPINLSSDASLDLSTERTDWPRRRPPEGSTARLSLPGKKLILETYQSETQSQLSPRGPQIESRPSPSTTEDFTRTEYLPKKMRAAEISGGKLTAARQSFTSTETPSTSAASSSDPSIHSGGAFLEDSKNVASRSKSIAAALVRGEQEAMSQTQAVTTLTPKADRGKQRKISRIKRQSTPEHQATLEGSPTQESCCGLDNINIKTGVICKEKHSEILNRERVISICNMDKHALDDYLNEGSSQEHEEELLQYFQRDTETEVSGQVTDVDTSANTSTFLGTNLDIQDEHSQGKSEKISQLRELLAKNLKNQSSASSQNLQHNLDDSADIHKQHHKPEMNEGVFKPVIGSSLPEPGNGQKIKNITTDKQSADVTTHKAELGIGTLSEPLITSNSVPNMLNGNCHNVPQSPNTRTQQYDFVPISDGCHSPRNFNTKSPLGFGHRSQSPSKIMKQQVIGGSLQTSPVSHSTAASPFVSPRNTPVPRSRLCPRPIPKVNGRKRNNILSLGIGDSCPKQFAMPNDQKFVQKLPICGQNIKYCQPMSAPPSPNILSSRFKTQFQSVTGISNGNTNLCLNFLNTPTFQENLNGEVSQPLSADPLSSEVSQFFHDSMATYRLDSDVSFRSQSVPLKQGLNTGLLSYMNTPVGSVPPTPIPNEFCDFGSLADTCDISKAGLNSETLDKIYDAIDSSNEVLNTSTLDKQLTNNLLNSNGSLTNGCGQPPSQELLTHEALSSLLPNDGEILSRGNQFTNSFVENGNANENVEDFLKRANSMEFNLPDLVMDKNKYYTSRSVPSTPLPFKRTAPHFQLDSRRMREIINVENYSNLTNGLSSKSVPSTPQLPEQRTIFSYSNRDFLINGNSVEVCVNSARQNTVVDDTEGLESPLHDILREDILEPLTPAAELLADLDKIDTTPYVDL